MDRCVKEGKKAGRKERKEGRKDWRHKERKGIEKVGIFIQYIF